MGVYAMYRGFKFNYLPKPIPSKFFDYDFYHEDYDGPGDPRCGNGESIEDCKARIDEILEDMTNE